MIAEDYAEEKESASKIYDCIRSKLLSVSGDHKLPIIYVIDSILKNAKGTYISIIEEDAKTWMSAVYREIPDKVGKEKLKKVWNTWNTFSVFAREKWEEMGTCFSSNTAGGDKDGDNSLKNINHNSDGVAGIPRSVCCTVLLEVFLVSCSRLNAFVYTQSIIAALSPSENRNPHIIACTTQRNAKGIG
jgi:pre-mRNA cleavage complex 2 protein Pcf11